MSDELIAWACEEDFSPFDAARAIAGYGPSCEVLPEAASRIFNRLQESYEESLNWLALGPDRWGLPRPKLILLAPNAEARAETVVPPPETPIASLDFQEYFRSIVNAESDLLRAELHQQTLKWRYTNASDFEKQRFSRKSLSDWTDKAGLKSAFEFILKPAAQPVAKSSRKLSHKQMVDAHESNWPRIKNDLKKAAQNDLHVAKAGTRGWYEDDALEWAQKHGRINVKSTANIFELQNFWKREAAT